MLRLKKDDFLHYKEGSFQLCLEVDLSLHSSIAWS